MFLAQFITILLICFSSLSATEAIKNYLESLGKYPTALGNAEKGEIQIIVDPTKIAEIEEKAQRSVGVVLEDKYWIWVNDAVKFPSGNYGVYGRLIWRPSLKGTGGVAVLPVLANGKVVLNRNFRHATRSWEYELPRGGLEEGETPQQGAIREAKEETGMILRECVLLGEIAPDTGLTGSVVPVFFARVTAIGESSREESEAIASVDAFTIEELKQGFINGYLTTTVNGVSCKVPLRDPFLAFALFQVEIRSLMK